MASTAFAPTVAIGKGTFAGASAVDSRQNVGTTSVLGSGPARSARPASVRMSAEVAGYSRSVDEYYAQSVRKQYIAKACPSGVPSLQCIEGNTYDAPYESRTLKRQSELRYRQLPVAVQLRNMYETRKSAIIAAHNCSHEESQITSNPKLAASMLLGGAEADRACNRYIESSGPVEDMMCRSVENQYMQAVNGSGVFSTACTDGQAKYEAYLAQCRGKAAEFRAKQYSPAQKAGASFAARSRAVNQNHICLYENTKLFPNYPRLAGSMRPAFGYYQPFVQSPRSGYGFGGIMDANVTTAIATVSGLSSNPAWFAAHFGGSGGM